MLTDEKKIIEFIFEKYPFIKIQLDSYERELLEKVFTKGIDATFAEMKSSRTRIRQMVSEIEAKIYDWYFKLELADWERKKCTGTNTAGEQN